MEFLLPPDVTLANKRSIDFAAAVKCGSDSDAHATKPSGLTSAAVGSLSSLPWVETDFNRSFQV